MTYPAIRGCITSVVYKTIGSGISTIPDLLVYQDRCIPVFNHAQQINITDNNISEDFIVHLFGTGDATINFPESSSGYGSRITIFNYSGVTVNIVGKRKTSVNGIDVVNTNKPFIESVKKTNSDDDFSDFIIITSE